jgi:hypothetical protein
MYLPQGCHPEAGEARRGTSQLESVASMDRGDVTWSPRRLRFLGRRGDLGMTRVHSELRNVCDVLGRASYLFGAKGAAPISSLAAC